jgi:hypothetical protein
MEMCDELFRYRVLTQAEYAEVLGRLQEVADGEAG